MKIMTYNVQSGRDAWGQLHLDGTAETINRLSPDICGLNEIRVNCRDSENIDQAEYLGQKTGMEAHFAKAIPLLDGEYGIGLLSRYPVSEFKVHPVPDVPAEEREKGYYENRVIYRAVVKTPDGDVAVFGSHFGLTRPERVYATRLLLSLVKEETLPVIFMGDLNMEPGDELIKQISAELTDLNRNPTYLTHHVLNAHNTIDYIFVRNLDYKPARAFFSCASDHMPVAAEVFFKKA